MANEVIQDIAVEKILKGDVIPAVERINGNLQDLNYKVPTPSEEAGTYVLKATVAADGSVTYAWVSAE